MSQPHCDLCHVEPGDIGDDGEVVQFPLMAVFAKRVSKRWNGESYKFPEICVRCNDWLKAEQAEGRYLPEV